MKRILFLAFFIFIFQNVQAENLGLSEAYENEIIEEVKSVFQTKGIEEKVERPICATFIFVEINFNKGRFSAKTVQLLKPYISRPDFGVNPEYTFDTPSGHFKIHYTTTGTDAVFRADEDKSPVDGVPDYVNRCADIFDSVWAKEVVDLGYNPPPSDGWYQPNGGDERYDIYLKNMNPLFYGYTDPESSSAVRPISYTSFIVVRNDYSNCMGHEEELDCLRATAAHEFFHSVQCGYDATEFEYIESPDTIITKQYWMEMSAVWMEDVVYDDVNDYIYYLRSFFDHPEWSLKTFGGVTGDVALHAYGSCIWPIYLSEKFERDIIRDIWDKCAEISGNNAIDYPGGESATEKALKARGSNFEDAFREFTVWNYFTADRARTQQFYSEGDLFPKVKVDSLLHYHTTYPVYSPSGPNHPQGLGSNYVVFRPEEEQGGLKLTFSPTTGEYQITAVGYNENVNEPLVQKFQINQQTGYAETDVYNWTSYNEIIMIPAVTSRNADSSFVYTYSAEYDSSLHGEHPFPQKDYVGQNFPNPFVINGGSDSTYFPFILSSVGEVEIGVFTVSGEKVWHYPSPAKKGKEWTIGDYTERGKCPGWDGKNEKGEYVSPGIYLYHVKTKNSDVIKKMAVIR
jgi:hypothetical protein